MNVNLANNCVVENSLTFEVSERERNKLLSAIEVLRVFLDPIPNIVSRPSELFLYNGSTMCGSIERDRVRTSIELMEKLTKAVSAKGTFKYKLETN